MLFRITMITALLSLGFPGLSLADTGDEARARQVYDRGRRAFDAGRYDDALRDFETSYQLSGRGELQYNIGITCEKLGREADALRAYRSFLELAPHSRARSDVKARIAVLEARYQRRSELGKDLNYAKKLRKRAWIGGSAIAALGLGMMTAGAVGFVRGGQCADAGMSGACVRSRTTQEGISATLLGVGAATLGGGLSWMLVANKRARNIERKHRGLSFHLGLTSAGVRGEF